MTLATKYCVALYGQLSKILGYGGGDVKVRKLKESPYVADLHGITSIYVYCTIVQPQIVGNTSVPLLRAIAVSGKSGNENVYQHSVRVRANNILRRHRNPFKDDTGDPVPFERGR